MGRVFSSSGVLFRLNTPPLTAVPITINGWLRTTNTTFSNRPLIAIFGSSSFEYFNLTYNAPGNLAAVSYSATDGAEVGAAASPGNLGDGNWHHIAGVWSNANSRTCYADGVGTTDTTASTAPIQINALSVGNQTDGTAPLSSTLPCELAEIGLWNVALSAPEMLALSRGLSPVRVRPANLMAYFPLTRDDGSGAANNYWMNSTPRDLGAQGTAPPVSATHPRVQMPFGYTSGWRGTGKPATVLVASNLAVGSPVFVAPAFTTFPRAADVAVSSPVLGQPAAKDKSPATAFTKTLAVPSFGWQGRTLRQRLEQGMLSAVDPGGLQVTLNFAAGTSGQIDALYVGHAAASGDPYDFDGNQVQLKFSGANTMAVSGAGSVQSDGAAFVYDPTRALIVSAAFSGTQVNLAAF